MATKAARIKKRRKLLSKQQGWTPELQTNLEEIGNEAATYHWLHRHSAIVLSDKLDKTSFWAAILSAVTGGGSILSFFIQIFDSQKELAIALTGISMIISFGATILLIIQQTYDYSTKIQNHKDAEKKYQWLSFKIQSQLQLPLIERQNGDHMFGWIAYIMNNISQIEDVEDDALERYKREFPGDTVPGIDGVRRIIVNQGDETDDEYSVSEKNTTPHGTPVPTVERQESVALDMNALQQMAQAEALEVKKLRSTRFKKDDIRTTKDEFKCRRGVLTSAQHKFPVAPIRSRRNKQLAYEVRRAQLAQVESNHSYDGGGGDSAKSLTDNIEPPKSF